MSLTHEAVERAFRAEAGQLLATLIGWLRDFQLAEDVLQDALVAALEHWPASGIPTRPGAWMLTVARRKALDRLRRGDGARARVSVEAMEGTLAAPPDRRGARGGARRDAGPARAAAAAPLAPPRPARPAR